MRKIFLAGIILAVALSSFLYFFDAKAFEIPNPIKYSTFAELIRAILAFLRDLALVLAPMVIIIAGFYFVTSVGDPAKVAQARQMILYALIGLVIVLVSEGIILLIERVIICPDNPEACPTKTPVDVMKVLDNITNWLFIILLSVAAIFIIVAGFYFVTSYGDPAQVTKARNFVIYALIGVLVAFAARGLVALVQRIVG